MAAETTHAWADDIYQALKKAKVAQIAFHPLPQVVQWESGRCARQQANAVAQGQQLWNQVRSQKTGAAGDQNFHFSPQTFHYFVRALVEPLNRA